MSDWQGLERYVAAQEDCYTQVLRELTAGRKRSHWMWFIFPQLVGLGRSETARYYALQSLDEARAYSRHAVLGERLRECTRTVLAQEDTSAEAIFGWPDVLKFHSCMTLFVVASPPEPLFRQALEAFYDGRKDEATLRLLDGGDG